MKNSIQFEQVIEYTFRDKNLLQKALTHSSFTIEHQQSRISGNERLEFLGDAFLDAIIGEELYRKFPHVGEGFLTKARASLVCEKTLAKIARELNIGSYINIGKGEETTGGRERSSILADAMEAVIGAMYLDGGYEIARAYVLRIYKKNLAGVKEETPNETDYKSQMQELLQAKGVLQIQYILEKEEGPDHSKIFFVSLKAGGRTLGHGSGKSKKEAEQMAAKDGIERRSHVF